MSLIALLSFFTGWWDELTLAKQIFYGLGIIAGIMSIVLMVLALVGMESHDAADFGGGTDVGTVDDHDTGNGLLSIKPVVGFFLGFGWCGGLALDAGVSIYLAVLIALFAGSCMMGLIYFLARAILGMRSDGTARIADAVGAVGTVYLGIPPKMGNGGQVTVSFKGRQETYAALSGGDAAIPSGSKVKVLSVIDSRTLLVEPLV